jgi:hypothetical protein
LLSVVEAARLRVICTALEVVVGELPLRLLKPVNSSDLEAALTCFPAAEEVTAMFRDQLDPADELQKVELLRQHGGTLKRVKARQEGAQELLSSAVSAGALPKLSFFEFELHLPAHRRFLSEGLLGLLEEAEVCLDSGDGEELSAVEHLRLLKHLRHLSWTSCGSPEAVFPPFIPPSLKILDLFVEPAGAFESLLRDLPSMLQTSGASLEEIKLSIPGELSAVGGAALAQVLRVCSLTLRRLDVPRCSGDGGDAFYRELVPGLVSCCDTLEILHCPWDVFRALPATCPSFRRLTELQLEGSQQVIESTSPVWDLIINGRMPALATLDLRTRGKPSWSRDEEGRVSMGGCTLARALEAAKGTLRRLNIICYIGGAYLDGMDGACRELGAAIAKLRRLRYLRLDLFDDGRAYHAVGQGLTAAGGCPELFELRLGGIKTDAEWLTREGGLVVPSVRKLLVQDRFLTEEEAGVVLWAGADGLQVPP